MQSFLATSADAGNTLWSSDGYTPKRTFRAFLTRESKWRSENRYQWIPVDDNYFIRLFKCTPHRVSISSALRFINLLLIYSVIVSDVMRESSSRIIRPFNIISRTLWGSIWYPECCTNSYYDDATRARLKRNGRSRGRRGRSIANDTSITLLRITGECEIIFYFISCNRSVNITWVDTISHRSIVLRQIGYC